MAGRPTDYNDDVAQMICETTANNSKGLAALVELNPHWPGLTTIRTWIRTNVQFRNQYAQAKKDQAHFLVEQIIDIADNDSNDTIIRTTKTGEEYEACNTEWLARSRLRVDTRKWLAAKLLPRMYGEKVFVDTNPDEDPEIQRAKALALKLQSGKNESSGRSDPAAG